MKGQFYYQFLIFSVAQTLFLNGNFVINALTESHTALLEDKRTTQTQN